MDPRSFPSLASGLMEPRGEPAVLILPRDVSVNREGERCGPRGGDGLGSSFGSASLPAFLQTERSPLPAVDDGHHTIIQQMRRFRLRHPAFPRDSVPNP